MFGDTTSQHRAHLFDLNCKICTGKMPAPREETVPSKRAKVTKTALEVGDDEEEQAGSSSGGRSVESSETESEMVEKSSSIEEMDDEDDKAEPL